MRSSYKFCNKKCDCHSQYGFLFNKQTRSCINDHYVHNKLVSDIDNLINYIQKNINNPNLEIELRKGLETICYVINHMNQELSSFALYFGIDNINFTETKQIKINNNEINFSKNINVSVSKYNIYNFYHYIPIKIY